MKIFDSKILPRMNLEETVAVCDSIDAFFQKKSKLARNGCIVYCSYA